MPFANGAWRAPPLWLRPCCVPLFGCGIWRRKTRRCRSDHDLPAAGLLALLPFLKYPANPPGIGEPSTIGSCTSSYFAMVVICLLVVLAAWRAARFLRERGVSLPVRQAAVSVGFAAIVGLLLTVLPPVPDPGDFPAGLLWNYPLSSLGDAGSVLRDALRAGQPQGSGRLKQTAMSLAMRGVYNGAQRVSSAESPCRGRQHGVSCPIGTNYLRSPIWMRAGWCSSRASRQKGWRSATEE